MVILFFTLEIDNQNFNYLLEFFWRSNFLVSFNQVLFRTRLEQFWICDWFASSLCSSSFFIYSLYLFFVFDRIARKSKIYISFGIITKFPQSILLILCSWWIPFAFKVLF